MHWEFGIRRCKLLYIGWINNKVLLYSVSYNKLYSVSGNYIQYPIINHNGKDYENEFHSRIKFYNQIIHLFQVGHF